MEAFIEEYTDLLVEKIFLLNGVLEATAGLLLILVPHAVFSRVAVSTTATSAARFYGLVVAIFAAVCILVTNGMNIVHSLLTSINTTHRFYLT